jgi:hypothetical protein
MGLAWTEDELGSSLCSHLSQLSSFDFESLVQRSSIGGALSAITGRSLSRMSLPLGCTGVFL